MGNQSYQGFFKILAGLFEDSISANFPATSLIYNSGCTKAFHQAQAERTSLISLSLDFIIAEGVCKLAKMVNIWIGVLQFMECTWVKTSWSPFHEHNNTKKSILNKWTMIRDHCLVLFVLLFSQQLLNPVKVTWVLWKHYSSSEIISHQHQTVFMIQHSACCLACFHCLLKTVMLILYYLWMYQLKYFFNKIATAFKKPKRQKNSVCHFTTTHFYKCFLTGSFHYATQTKYSSKFFLLCVKILIAGTVLTQHLVCMQNQSGKSASGLCANTA